MAEFTDKAGADVLRFTSAVQNLSRVGELTDEIVDMAESGKWRRYKTAVGTDKWGEAEFDFFLIACGLTWDDVSRVLAWSHKGEQLMPFMDPTADGGRRRTLEQAAQTWHAPGPETLIERAQRLGWTKGKGADLRIPPIQRRARLRHEGTTREEKEQAARRQRIPAGRRRELDRLAKHVAEQTTDETEYRFVLDCLRKRFDVGRPRQTKTELESWRRDADQLGWNSAALAERWGIGQRAARQRIARLRAT